MIQRGSDSMPNEIKGFVLDDFIKKYRPSNSTSPEINVSIKPDVNYLNIRGSVNDRNFLEHAESILQQALPLEFNTFTVGDHHIYWLGPNEWLVVTDFDLDSILQKISKKIDLYATNQTGGLTQLILRGNCVRSLLARGCTLDVSEGNFLIGQCAQTGLSKAGILLALTDSSPSFNLIVRRSFAEYVGLWLEQSGSEFGINFVQEH